MYKNDYSAEQLSAIESDSDRTLVLSVAGSGKTRVLCGHILWVLERRVCEPQDIAAITFTNAAAAVLKERVKVRLGYVGTIHSLMLRLVNRAAEQLGFQAPVGVVDAERSAAIVGELKRQHRFRGTEEELRAAMKKRGAAVGNPSPADLVAVAYRQRLRQSNCVDFDGLLFYGRLAVAELAEAGRFPYSVLLWDEAQDMSDEFYAIYTAMPVRHRMAVGDPWQSIFSFLGGNVQNILKEAARGVRKLHLSTNYRSAKSICRAATALVAAGGGTERTLPRPDAPEGRCEMACYADEDAEVKAIAQKIRELEAEERCAVLVRTNALRDTYAAALESYSIPVSKREHAESAPDWAVVKAMLLCLQSPDNDLLSEAFVAALRGPEQAAVSRREAVQKQASLNEHCLHFPLLDTAASALAFVASKNPSAAALERLRDAAEPLEQDATVGDLVLALNEPEKAEDATPGVVVSTIHSAKGREWETVFLPCTEESVLPSNRDARDRAALEEARRLFYVAATRARQNLFVSYVRTRRDKWNWDEAAERQPSRFAAEAGMEIP